MAKLTAKARSKIPSSEFAGPGRSYPINDKNHARAALSMLHNAPSSEQPKIRAKAERKLESKAKGGSVKCSTPFNY
jgi:hypothetical protein